jgi:hypothetical protein
MVSPVRIRVPPLKKMLQIEEKGTALAVILRLFFRGVSTAGSRNGHFLGRLSRSLACLLWRGSSCYRGDLGLRGQGGVKAAKSGPAVHHGTPSCLLELFDAAASSIADWQSSTRRSSVGASMSVGSPAMT